MPRMYQTFGRRLRDPGFERIIRIDAIEYFAQNFKDVFSSHRYIPAPDFGTGGDEMAVIFNQTMDPASVTGKPSGVHGWLPGRREATGWGCFEASRLVMEEVFDGELEGCSVVIQGFGNVARWASSYLHDRGCRIIAVTDSRGGAHDPGGLDIPALIEHKESTGHVSGFAGDIDNESMFRLDVDILIPAALGDAIREDNASDIGARAIVEGANMPVSCGGMEILDDRGITVVPDIIANAGGVIASMEEYSGSLSAIKVDRSEVLGIITDKISRSFRESLDLSSSEEVTLAEAAVQMAMERTYDAMRKRSFI
jgi:glutamate dehydrogenase/leucine dehydrogenase